MLTECEYVRLDSSDRTLTGGEESAGEKSLVEKVAKPGDPRVVEVLNVTGRDL
jgi:hypothetical protein